MLGSYFKRFTLLYNFVNHQLLNACVEAVKCLPILQASANIIKNILVPWDYSGNTVYVKIEFHLWHCLKSCMRDVAVFRYPL